MMLFVGCSYNELPEELGVDLPIDERISFNVETRAEVYNGEELDREYFVTATDLENFVKFRRNTSKRSNLSVKEVKSYGFDSSQTLFYILNYDEGWEVVAADKRVQPTLAQGDSGEFTMESNNEPMKFWMNMLADGVLQTRQRSDDAMAIANTTASTNSDTTTPSTSEKQYVDFWESISPTKNETKGGHLTPIIGPTQPIDGPQYIYLIDTEQEYRVIEYPEFIVTEWHQDAPWNAYCPLKTDGSGDRAPAGCVAISASQVLYYLHERFNATWYAPSHCFYSGNIDNYSIFFDQYQTSIWGNMAISEGAVKPNILTEYSAMLIAYVGQLIDMEYGNNGSSAFTMDLKEKVFSEFDITCSESNSFNQTAAINNIRDGLPIILRGESSSGGHSWIADGYKMEYNLVTNYYVRFSTEQSPLYISTLDKDDAHFTSTTESIISQQLHMNWGWNDTNDGEYSIYMTDWLYPNTVKMVYNFQNATE